MSTGMTSESFSARAMARECAATCSSVSGPYRCWLPVTNHTSNCLRSIIGASLFSLPVHMHIAVMQFGDIVRGDLIRRAELQRQPDGVRDIFHHHRGLDRLGRRGTDREDTVILQEHSRRAADVLDHLLSNLLAPDQRKTSAGNRAAKLVRDR